MEYLQIALMFLLALLAQPGFWYCMVALTCASVIAAGMRAGGYLVGVAILRAAPRFHHREDDDDFSPIDLIVPPSVEAIRDHEARQVMDAAKRTAG